MKKLPTFLRQGFTLIELLVASAVFILFLALLSGVINSVSNMSSQAAGRLDAVRQGREIFDLIQKDLAQAVPAIAARGTNSAPQFWVNPPTASLPDTYKNPTAVFWQSPIARDRSAGNLAIVGYFVHRPSANQSQLRRILIEPSDTANYKLYPTNSSTNASGDWLSPAIAAQFVGTGNSTSSTNADKGWVASGVLGLWVRCLDANGHVITTNGADTAVGWAFDSRSGFRSGTGANATVRTGVNALPAFVDVGLVCVAAREADRITSLHAIPAGSPATFDADIAAYLANVQSANPRLKTATSLTRRFRVAGGN
jgi:prepilin-type N-terminal cleavage/methylation domain-containing protein